MVEGRTWTVDPSYLLLWHARQQCELSSRVD